MADLTELLRAVDAPEGMLGWARLHGDDLESAWDACPRADWQVWLAGVAAVSLGDLLLVLSGWAGEVLAQVPDAEELVLHVLEQAEGCVRRQVPREEAIRAAELAEQAARDAPATFRDRLSHGYSPLVSAAAWIARAAEGLLTVRLRAEADRMQRAQQTASYLGAGVNALVANEPPVRLAALRVPDDAFHAELLYVVAAGAEAADGIALAMELAESEEPRAEASAEAHAAGAARIRALFDE